MRLSRWKRLGDAAEGLSPEEMGPFKPRRVCLKQSNRNGGSARIKELRAKGVLGLQLTICSHTSRRSSPPTKEPISSSNVSDPRKPLLVGP